MTKGLYQHLRQAWKKPDIKVLRQRMIEWRASNAIVKVDRPLRLDRAHSLGYKAKKGYVIARIRIIRGGRKREKPNKGRKIKRQTNKKVLKMNYKWVAEQRVQRKFKNLEVLNSYQIGKDGKHYFFEVILMDPNRPEIKNNKKTNWITKPANKNRVLRGKTSAARKSRGLRDKNPMNKNRPSVRAGKRRGK